MSTKKWAGSGPSWGAGMAEMKPPPPRYAVIPGFCSECGKDKPCVIQVPFRTMALEAGMIRPLCRECLVRMLDTLGEWELDQELLVEARARSGEGALPSSPAVDEVEEEPREAVQAGLDAGEGEEADTPLRVVKAEWFDGQGFICHECLQKSPEGVYRVKCKDIITRWYCKDCVPDEVLKKLEEVKDE